jgi:hypothetical protein
MLHYFDPKEEDTIGRQFKAIGLCKEFAGEITIDMHWPTSITAVLRYCNTVFQLGMGGRCFHKN